jgi:dienelactone hydrolase
MRMHVHVASLVLALAFLQTGPGPQIWAGLAPGAHAIGFAAGLARDPSRTLDGAARPIQVACWYPARPSTAAPMRFRQYFVLGAAERGPASPDAERAVIDDEKAFFKSMGVDGALVDRWLESPMYARSGAAPADQTFPLVLVAQGNSQSAHHQAVLSEFVASHGFIVCTTPSQVRLGDAIRSEADVLPGAIAQAADLAVAERYARARFKTQPARAALVAHSFGARSALVYAARHGATALVSLDGGIGAAEARTWVDGAAIDRARFATPILHVYERGDRAITPDLALIRSLAGADRTLVQVDGLRHIDFTSLGFGSAAVSGLTGPPSADMAAKLRAVGSAVVQFIEAAEAGTRFAPGNASEPWIHVERLEAGKARAPSTTTSAITTITAEAAATFMAVHPNR